MICKMNRRNNGLQKVNIILLCVLLILTSKGILDNVTENTEYHSHELNYRDYVHQNRLLNLFSEEQTSTSSDDEATSGEDSTHRSRGVKCNVTRKQLKGREDVDLRVLRFTELEEMFPDHKGGRYRPSHCNPSSRIAIVIPYRDREIHLKLLLLNLIPKLRRQLTDFTIYVIEQAETEDFNRGMMRNIGFVEAKKRFPYDCYVFNDVDTIIEDDRNLMKCGTDFARHLVSGVRRYNYSLPYRGLLGGVIALTDTQMTTLNGYSNMFFVWGGEDDNLFDRFVESRLWFDRTDYQDGFVTTLAHKKGKKFTSRFRTGVKTKHSRSFDGVSSLRYEVILVKYKPLFTWIVEFLLNGEKLKQWRDKSNS
ncbi:beta-1,4-N-acetylgalactosaminyltransferase bre-4-like isoform X2 [Ostrea edulis]|uniref:beta-1,4-N-acetylgalactosaminyltransferase bre-4-like isoform X2 n=1 Tax=Ostrea edulis TaxID=37623 RepID=UPI0020956C76|nr:beta-1,4-N-acetylgalactosaminyltransferase bre-4-like isoform X2 [Ostrea edulis]